MDDDLDPLIKNAIIDRLEGWELVEFLGISIEEIVEMFEEKILENIKDVKEEIGFEEELGED